MWMIVAPVPVASSTATATRATAEKRGTTTLSAARRRPAPRLNHRISSPTRPPIQIEPEIRCTASNGTDRPRGEVCPAWPTLPGSTSTAAAAIAAPTPAASSATDRTRALGPVHPQRDPAGDAEEREAHLHVDVAAPERGGPEQWHQRAEVEHRAKAVLRDREVEVDGDRHQPDHRRHHEAHRERRAGWLPAPAGPRTRAIRSRIASRPIATITLRNIAQRAISSGGVTAVAETWGIGNCGAGPGLGPTRR